LLRVPLTRSFLRRSSSFSFSLYILYHNLVAAVKYFLFDLLYFLFSRSYFTLRPHLISPSFFLFFNYIIT
jgi:hypothetical protein